MISVGLYEAIYLAYIEIVNIFVASWILYVLLSFIEGGRRKKSKTTRKQRSLLARFGGSILIAGAISVVVFIAISSVVVLYGLERLAEEYITLITNIATFLATYGLVKMMSKGDAKTNA